MPRKLHQFIDLVLTALGIVITIGSVAIADQVSLQVQVGWIVLGILLIEAGVGGFSSQFMANDRRFLALRKEGDKTIRLIRQLNAAAIARDHGAEDDTRFHETLAEMHATIQRMAELASQEEMPANRRDGSKTQPSRIL